MQNPPSTADTVEIPPRIILLASRVRALVVARQVQYTSTIQIRQTKANITGRQRKQKEAQVSVEVQVSPDYGIEC